MKDPSFLTLAEVLDIHSAQIERHGGEPALRDRGLLESALAMPEATFGGKFLHASLPSMAAAYAYHIAQNQAFADGNKRTGLAAALVFLDINGIRLEDPKGRLYTAMLDIAERKLSKQGLAEVFEDLAA